MSQQPGQSNQGGQSGNRNNEPLTHIRDIEGVREYLPPPPPSQSRPTDFIMENPLQPRQPRPQPTGPHKCPICNSGFDRPSTRDVHQRSHKDDTPYICPYCSKGFKTTSNLNRHVKVHVTPADGFIDP